MSSFHIGKTTGINSKGKTGRNTRAGNDLDAFPFDKLSVDGAALARMIISPLRNPAFRARNPLEHSDNTSNTESSSDEDIQDPNPRKGKRVTKSNDHKEQVEVSPKQEHIAFKIDQTQRTETSPSSHTSRGNAKFYSELKSPDPDAKHISYVSNRSTSRSIAVSSEANSSDSDSYYETFDSPRAFDENKYYSDVESWESGMIPTLEDEILAPPDNHISPRVAPDGKSQISPKHQEKLLIKQTLLNQSFDASPIDPDGADFNEDNDSTTGENLVPTPDSDFAMTQDLSRKLSTNLSLSSSSSSSEEVVDHSSEKEIESGSEEFSFDDLESPPSSVYSEKQTPKVSLFPSNRLLVCMVVTIALMVIGLVAGLAFYMWEMSSIDPICRPDDLCCNNPSSCSDLQPTLDGDDLSQTSLTPSDEELLKIFQSVVGEAATSDFTSAGMAANWMLYEDPGKLLKPRSDQAWIQRYLLVYTYFATTLNRSSAWLSCNPPTEDELKLDDSDSCMFTYSTELPGGTVVYDLVPSQRWLSAVDECQWGGVACGVTVEDEINIDSDAEGSNIPIKSTMRRLAVTSIDLADQSLRGSLVTELSALPMLQVLDLSHNGLQGTISENFGSLKTLRLQHNAIQGSIPSNFFNEQSVMKELNVGSNFMTGTIPNEVGLASFMTDLYLFKNRFTGSIPSLGNMPLVNFHGQQNSFTGVMPFDYDFGGSWPKTLREWWVFDNKLSGPLSENLGFITNLEDIRVYNNGLKGSIPESIKDLQRLFRFDVQANSLTGTVPESIGSLPQLRDVNLQFNNFEGIVPTSLCYLESMEVLEADCLAFEGEPRTDCYCCTTCCNPGLGGCQSY